MTTRDWIFRIFAYILLTAFGLFMLFPFIYMMMTSLKTSNDVFNTPPRLLPRSPVTVEYEGEERPTYRFEIDGETVTMVPTGERVRFGFFTTPELINASSPRDSEILYEIPFDEAVETGETLTLNGEEFDLYQITIDGETLTVPLAYRGSKDEFVSIDDPTVRTFAVERLANQVEKVEFQFNNYQAVFDLKLDRALVNTTIVTVGVVIGQLITSIMGGYAFSRIRFKGRDTIFLMYLGSIMIPFVVLIIPIYRLMVVIGWQNRIVSLIVPWIFSAYGTFLMRQFFISIPKEIEEAALMDGASRFRILWTIFVPLSRPAIATLAIFSFLYAWNSFLWPLLIIGEGNVDNHVLTLSLIRLSNSFADQPNMVLTGAAVAILPPILIFILAQRYFIEGVATSGLKG
ncbi:MAG: hypothetical protein Kow00117_12110 [Phototrophicales bacterium]